jgi:nickel/cobalt transporter (NicO) family protein
LASAVIILSLALWMAWRTYRDIKAEAGHGHHHHGEHTEEFWIQTGHGSVKLEVFEEGL